ncbi:MAG: LptF/LptG family permease [Campylobacterota bacterium]|nr:LptF/LptG family permease [Campylobacterota bacterium]
MLTFKYIAWHYFKYFLIVLLALVFFMVGFDYMQVSKDLPSSANLVVIYVVFKSFFAIDMMLPLSLVFGMIATKVHLIRSNALVAFYSLGYSKTDILKPFVIVSGLIVIIYISLHTTAFARADEYSNNIRSSSQFLKPTQNLFFTYEDKYVYFGHLYPLQERAEDIRIFTTETNELKELLVAKEAYYREGYWHIKEAKQMQKPKNLSLRSEGIVLNTQYNLQLLKGFRPKILDQVYEGKVNFTIIDAIDAMVLLQDQNINIDKIKSALYRMFIHPFFVPSLIVIIFFFVPISSRFLNVSLFSFGAILATLIIWAILFMMIELSNTKTIPSEVGVVLPVVILFSISLYIWYKNCSNCHLKES